MRREDLPDIEADDGICCVSRPLALLGGAFETSEVSWLGFLTGVISTLLIRLAILEGLGGCHVSTARGLPESHR